MIHATLIPVAVASLVFGGAPEVPSNAVLAPSSAAHSTPLKKGDYKATFRAPSLLIEGEPYRVTVDILAVGDKPCDMPVWLLTPAAWLVNNKPLMRREAEGKIELQPGQTLSMTIDLAGLVSDRFDGEPDDFRVAFADSGMDAQEVISLELPERGINFEELPKEQLGNYHVVLQTTGGMIWLEMWDDVAPNHVRNFLDLASDGFYDGSEFYRVIPTFMVQGGRAASGEAPPRKLDAEFSSRKHEAGVLSAARLGNDINSATSEFFIVHKKTSSLDGKYSAFGRVLDGMDAVDKIVKGVETHYALVNRWAEKRITMDSQSPLFQKEMNRPNPHQVITQALVVKATKSRPDRK